MENTVCGYSRLEITNNSNSDIACFLADKENENVAVAACYIQAGDKFTINSIVHGDYYLFVQCGEDYISELGIFSKNNKTLVYDAKVQANVVGGQGFHTVGIVKVTQDDIDTCDFDLGCSPELGE